MTSGKRAKAQRRAGGRQAAAPAPRRAAVRGRRRRLGVTVAAAVVVGAGVAIGLSASAGSAPGEGGSRHLRLEPLSALGRLRPAGSPGPIGPEGVPVPVGPALAVAAPAASQQSVDGIECETSEQTLFHIHTHLTVFVDGSPRQVPYGIGIPGAETQATPQGPFVGTGSCFYWLHTHAADGIIHIESPVRRPYTLGDFFDIWQEPLGANEVGPAAGRVTAFYDGKLYVGDPRNLPLEAHAQIQLDVGRPIVAPVSIHFPAGL